MVNSYVNFEVLGREQFINNDLGIKIVNFNNLFEIFV